MNELYYIGYYDTFDYPDENRSYALSGRNKMEYISHAISESGYKINIVSPAWTSNSSGRILGRKIQLSDNINLIMFSTFGTKHIIGKVLRKSSSLFKLFIFLYVNLKKNDKVILYHSLDLVFPLYFLKKLKKFELILEVEEIYQDVRTYGKFTKLMEYKIFESANKFIFSNDLLNQRINKKNVPFCVIYGIYKKEKINAKKFNDNKIHLVYAGTFDLIKGGAKTAILSANYLDSNYHLHIIGFGSNDETTEIKKLVEIESMKTNCKITYDGLLKGSDYNHFLQKCHIGLSSQVVSGNYSESSFPSKILSYISNDLIVISVNLKVLECSKLHSNIFYFESGNPENLANTILQIKINDVINKQDVLDSLNDEFRSEIIKLLES